MLIHITIAFAGDHIEMKVAQPYIHRVETNLVAIEKVASKRKHGPMVLAIGESARALHGSLGSRVVPAYDPDAFEPELTGTVISYYRNVLFTQVRPRLIEMFTLGFLDRLRIDILLPRYEQLPTSAKDRFVRSLGMAWFHSEISVNQHQLPKPRS